jgi:hypothetical protein
MAFFVNITCRNNYFPEIKQEAKTSEVITLEENVMKN